MILVKDNNGKIHQTTDGSIINQSGSINYSTEEQYTGKNWIDGKKIYQKVIYYASLNAGENNQNLSELNIDHILFIQGTAFSHNTYQIASPDYHDYTDYSHIFYNVTTKMFTVITGTIYPHGPAYYNIQYTKTTE